MPRESLCCFWFLMHRVCFKPLESVLFLSLGFAELFRRMFLSVVVVTEEECEFASFFGQPSFVLFFALFLDRFFTQDIQKYVNNLQAVLDISSTNSTIATDAWVNEPHSLFSLLASKKISLQCTDAERTTVFVVM